MPPVCFQYHPQTSRNQALIPGPRETHFRDWFARDSPLQGRVVRTPMETVDEWFLTMRKRLRSPRGLATVHTPEGMPLPPKILVCAAIVKIRDEHRLGGFCATELLEFSSDLQHAISD